MKNIELLYNIIRMKGMSFFKKENKKQIKQNPTTKKKRGDLLKDVRLSKALIEPKKISKDNLEAFKLQIEEFIKNSPEMEQAKKEVKKDKKIRGEPLKYKQEYCYKVVELMAEGKDKITAITELGIVWDTFYRWIEKYPEFKFSVRIGEQLQKRYWIDLGRLNIANKNFSYVGWMMNMTNRLKWVNSRNKNHHSVKKTLKKEIDVKIEDKRIARIVNMAKSNDSITEFREAIEDQSAVHTN